VHLPFKRAMHAIDPLQRLRLLRHRLAQLPDGAFHAELLRIFVSLGDLHTNYILPDRYVGSPSSASWSSSTTTVGRTGSCPRCSIISSAIRT